MLNTIITDTITLKIFLICTGISLALGIGTALVYGFKNRCTQSFAVTLAMLPAIVQIVIMLVNGNIGAGVAVAGAFSLVRFRSAPGTAKEIGAIFLAMAIGLATGMGYVALAVLFFVILAVFIIILTLVKFGSANEGERSLKITIPENLDYDGLFDDLFEKYTKHCSLEKVKTANMGTVYELQYNIILRQTQIPKDFIDEIRCRNGNLNIVCSKVSEKEAL
ncbi:MAG: DUF4956 domain-containing protein [Clostridia bacterium]|nr:DUF4956 domain-containing protein [Clostridia bacterium]